jgi:phospholipid N-methyltransferase
MVMVKDCLAYLRESFKGFYHTGSVFPTSRWAAAAMTKPLHQPRKAQRILEAGPGTGCITVKILKEMTPEDTLTICEINSAFMKLLKERLSTDPNFIRHKDRITFFEGPIQDLPEGGLFDVIVCALPFLNFDLKTVKEIFAKFRRMSTKDTVMTYYEYIGLRDLGKHIPIKDRQARLNQLDSFFSGMHEEHRLGREKVWLNILPINIYTMSVAA